MSTMKSFLVLVFVDRQLSKESEWIIDPRHLKETVETTLIETGNQDILEELRLFATPARAERHLVFELQQPISGLQLWALEQLKKRETISNFYVKDEISHE